MMPTHDMPDVEAEIVRQALLSWRADGVATPKIAVGRDVDGDGIDDFYGLGENDELVLLSGVIAGDTVSESTGAEGF